MKLLHRFNIIYYRREDIMYLSKNEDILKHCLNQTALEEINRCNLLCIKKELQFQIKADVCFDKESNRKKYKGFSKILSKIKLANGNQQERAKLAVVEEHEPNVGNQDLILCK